MCETGESRKEQKSARDTQTLDEIGIRLRKKVARKRLLFRVAHERGATRTRLRSRALEIEPKRASATCSTVIALMLAWIVSCLL